STGVANEYSWEETHGGGGGGRGEGGGLEVRVMVCVPGEEGGRCGGGGRGVISVGRKKGGPEIQYRMTSARKTFLFQQRKLDVLFNTAQ
ncbi:hypothetical protein BaRGS_00006545, partial [Batillaria attramentaria]